MSIIRNFIVISVVLLIIFNRSEKANCSTSGSIEAQIPTEKDGVSGSQNTNKAEKQQKLDDCKVTLNNLGFEGDMNKDCVLIRDTRQYSDYLTQTNQNLDEYATKLNDLLLKNEDDVRALDKAREQLNNDLKKEINDEEREALHHQLLRVGETQRHLDVAKNDLVERKKNLEERQKIMNAENPPEFPHINENIKNIIMEVNTFVQNMENENVKEKNLKAESIADKLKLFELLLSYIQYVEAIADTCKVSGTPNKTEIKYVLKEDLGAYESIDRTQLSTTIETPLGNLILDSPNAPIGNLVIHFCDKVNM